jgi:cysteine desulfurase/selenocysteine lyase
LSVAIPAGLPDADTLARLASEFFSALPGNAGGVTGFAPGVQAAPAQDGAGFASRSPSLAPAAAAPNGLPDTATTAGPASDGRAGGVVLGVPEAYAAALPSAGTPSPFAALDAAHGPVPSTPYYFLGEASGYPSSLPQDGDAAPVREDRVTAQPYALPGAVDLSSLFAPADTAPRDAGSAGAPGSGSWFYFADPAALDKTSVPSSGYPPFNVQAIRRDFPILAERVNGRQLVWFDNAATTQKPQAVIDRLAYFYAHENSNVHRGAHELAARSTDAYEAARSKVARFLGASSAEEIIFVRGATEAINLVAQSWGRANIGAGDEIVVSHLEHHANIVPWQQLASEKGAKIRVIPVDDSGQVLLEEYRRLLNDRTKIVAVTQVSNALGTVVPVDAIVKAAHAVGARVLVDGAQSVSHLRVNMQAMDPDFFVFSGHKIFGPTGIGVVYGKRELLEQMPPWQGGGNMIADVTFERTVYQAAPARFEAGTGNLADAVGLGAALDYVDRIGLENIARYEHDLLVYATQGVLTVPGLRLIGTAREKASVLSLVLNGWDPEDVGRALNQEGIAVRAGHHCAQPILRRFGLEATVRPSLAFYNTCEEVDCLVAVLRRLAQQRRAP